MQNHKIGLPMKLPSSAKNNKSNLDVCQKKTWSELKETLS